MDMTEFVKELIIAHLWRNIMTNKEQINFYHLTQEYGCFSNFSRHSVWMKGKLWPTSEHYFQSQKFAGRELEETIRQAESPKVAAAIGRKKENNIREDWNQVKDSIMFEVVLAKFEQHEDLRQILLSTGNLPIVEHTPNDKYWGDGGDGTGRNMLGIILVKVRNLLREATIINLPIIDDDIAWEHTNLYPDWEK